MTRTMKVAGTLLTASLADRVLNYLLLPFGEEGRTSLGRMTASRGSNEYHVAEIYIEATPENAATVRANMARIVPALRRVSSNVSGSSARRATSSRP